MSRVKGTKKTKNVKPESDIEPLSDSENESRGDDFDQEKTVFLTQIKGFLSYIANNSNPEMQRVINAFEKHMRDNPKRFTHNILYEIVCILDDALESKDSDLESKDSDANSSSSSSSRTQLSEMTKALASMSYFVEFLESSNEFLSFHTLKNCISYSSINERLEDENQKLRYNYIGEGIFECKFCGSRKTSYNEKQVRSADEPMNVFVRCSSCGKNWKF